MRATGSLPEGYEVLDFLTSTTYWFVLTTIPGLIFLEREAFEMSMEVDFITDNLLVKAYQRFFTGYYNPRAVFGSTPAT
jgi:hypothetical protein